jgi:hypothetical protein
MMTQDSLRLVCFAYCTLSALWKKLWGMIKLLKYKKQQFYKKNLSSYFPICLLAIISCKSDSRFELQSTHQYI